MRSLRRPSTAVNALLALLIVGAAFWGWTLLRDTSQTTGANASGVRTVTATQGTVTRTVSADGSVASAATATAVFATTGTVVAIPAKVGRQVKAGALLARIDAADAKRDLELAQANLEAAADALERAQNAGTDTDSAANAVVEAELAVDEAEAALAGTRLTAPMTATVTAVNGTLGGSSTVSTQDTARGFVELADLTRLQVTAAFSESDATELKAGQSATVVWNALPDAETTGEVVAVDPTGSPSPSRDGTVAYGVTISLPNPPNGAKPGQTVTVSVVTGSAENAVMVNSAAVTATGGRRIVTVVDSTGRQQVRPIQVGLEGDDAVQITSGLAVGERVVLPSATRSSTATSDGRGAGEGLPGGAGGTGGR